MYTDCVYRNTRQPKTRYTQVKVPGTKIVKGAHIIAWEEANGPVPEGMYVLHHCDNPACCNAEHLFVGTQKENQADMVRKGRLGRRAEKR